MFAAELVLIIFGAIALDLVFGDPKNRYHPTAWAGRFIAVVIPAFSGHRRTTERFGGVIVVVSLACMTTLILWMLDYAITQVAYQQQVAYQPVVITVITIISGCILLKCTIALHGMQRHAEAVVFSLTQNKTVDARASLAMIVKRRTGALNKEQIISGVLESIGENTVDGITGSLFYYGLFGLPGAFVHRIVNTADSMIGYRTKMLGNLGWFAARCDTVLNYLPARLTGLAMVWAAVLLRYDWRNAYRTMIRDTGRTSSYNSGYTMAALAGALGVRLEKEGHYVVGADGAAPTAGDVRRAILLMKTTAALFAGAVALPAALAIHVTTGLLSSGMAGL